jgi:hypothetical protein
LSFSVPLQMSLRDALAQAERARLCDADFHSDIRRICGVGETSYASSKHFEN